MIEESKHSIQEFYDEPSDYERKQLGDYGSPDLDGGRESPACQLAPSLEGCFRPGDSKRVFNDSSHHSGEEFCFPVTCVGKKKD